MDVTAANGASRPTDGGPVRIRLGIAGLVLCVPIVIMSSTCCR
jgi:hypothetical protein